VVRLLVVVVVLRTTGAVTIRVWTGAVINGIVVWRWISVNQGWTIGLGCWVLEERCRTGAVGSGTGVLVGPGVGTGLGSRTGSSVDTITDGKVGWIWVVLWILIGSGFGSKVGLRIGGVFWTDLEVVVWNIGMKVGSGVGTKIGTELGTVGWKIGSVWSGWVCWIWTVFCTKVGTVLDSIIGNKVGLKIGPVIGGIVGTGFGSVGWKIGLVIGGKVGTGIGSVGWIIGLVIGGRVGIGVGTGTGSVGWKMGSNVGLNIGTVICGIVRSISGLFSTVVDSSSSVFNCWFSLPFDCLFGWSSNEPKVVKTVLVVCGLVVASNHGKSWSKSLILFHQDGVVWVVLCVQNWKYPLWRFSPGCCCFLKVKIKLISKQILQILSNRHLCCHMSHARLLKIQFVTVTCVLYPIINIEAVNLTWVN
jgi:hypothetical protein